jgi:hypothetical protein
MIYLFLAKVSGNLMQEAKMRDSLIWKVKYL